jgi:hypothetical protein
MNTQETHLHLLEIADRIEVINLHLGAYADNKGAMSILFDAMQATRSLESYLQNVLLDNGLAERKGELVLRADKVRYKIQTACAVAGFWGDLKSSEEGGAYVTDLFESIEEAQQEVAELNEINPEDEYRIVPELTPSEVELY